jgi:hypothetical protein
MTALGNKRPILFAAALLALLAPSAASAASVVNGDFEAGSLKGWHVHRATEAGNWFAYEGTSAPIGSKRGADPVQAPPQGTYAATTDEANPESLILYQDIALEPGFSHRLSLLAYYNSYRPIAIPTPDTLSVDEESLAGQPNQQYRIDVMKPDAPLESVEPADILRTLLRTNPGGPENMAPTKLTADLTPFAGQTVRLRIANAVNQEVFNAGVDAISISSTAPGGTPAHGRLSLGKARANRKNGTAILPARVPGPGLLKAKGGGGPASARASGSTKRPRTPIEPVTVRVTAPGKVMIHLKPTPSARAILRQKHKLRVKVAVTFAPPGESPQAASQSVLLELAPRAAH